MSDKYDEKAATLVSHCRYCDRDYTCPDDVAQDRADVAAALREQGVEITALKAELAEAEKRGMERAISLVGETAEFYFGIEHQALLNAIANIRAAMEGE